MSRRLGLLLAVAVSLGVSATAAAVAFPPGSARIVDARAVLRFTPSQIPPVDILALAPDGSRVAYRTSGDRLGLLDLVHDTTMLLPARVPLVPVHHGAYVADPSVAFSPEGRRLVYRDGTDVKTIDLRRRTAHTIGWSPSGPVFWLRDGRIAFAGRRHRLTFVSAGGHTRTTPLEVSPRWSLSPDGETALVMSRCRARLVDVSGGRARTLGSFDVPEHAWAPDGAHFVLQRAGSCGGSSPSMVDALFDRGGRRIGGDVTGQSLSTGHGVSWSNDGRWLFVAVQPTGTEVTGYQLVDALSLRTLRVSTLVPDGNVGQPLMGPGSWLVFGRYAQPKLAASGASAGAIFVARLVG
jgi:hypothetical protein